MIPQTFIQDLLNRIDIVDVVSKYVQLKKGGANLMGLCPFHNEKSPSFTVSPTKQFYHCFGCGAHGTAIGFLIEYSGLSFVETIKDLAQSVGMTVPDNNDKIPSAQQATHQTKNLALSEAMVSACDFYRQQLRNSPQAINYLKKRGLTGEIAAKYGLGYAPDNWDNLSAVFPNYEATTLVEAGLIIDRTNESGNNRKRYDRFRNRIMFPIKNIRGQIIAFGGRVLDDAEPKYLNSPETPLFQKGNELYGLFEARQAIRDARYVLVTEGYMDVVALSQLGFPQAVATLGTACTPTHVHKLLRQTDHIIFSFDGDRAGRHAARRALDACLPHTADDKIIRFLFLPREHDPDSFVRELGAEEFKQQIHDAMPLSQFLLNEVTTETDLSTPEGRAHAQFIAKPLLQIMPPSSLRLQIVRSLAQLTQSTSAEIEVLFELSKPISRTKLAPPRNNRPPPVGLERQIIRLLLTHPTLASELDDAGLTAMMHSAPNHAEMLEHLIAASQSMGEQANFAVLTEHLRDDSSDFKSLIAEIAAESESSIETARLELAGAIRQIKMQVLKKEMAQLAATGLGDEAAHKHYRALIQQQEQLRREAQTEMTRH